MLNVGRRATSVLTQPVPGTSACVLLLVLSRQAFLTRASMGARLFSDNKLSCHSLYFCTSALNILEPLLLGAPPRVILGSAIIIPVRCSHVCFRVI